MARLCRRRWRRSVARSGSRPGKHGDRCGGRRSRHRARPHGACRVGFDRPPTGASFDVAMPVSYGYWIVCSKAVAKLPKIMAFSEWLLAEAAEDARQLDRLAPKARQTRRATR